MSAITTTTTAEPTSAALVHLLPLLDGFAPLATRGSYHLMEAVDDVSHRQLRAFICEQFQTHFGAEVPDDTPRLLGIFDQDAELVAAFGIRTRDDGFFSEHYLGAPLDAALQTYTGETYDLSRVAEVSHFSIAKPRAFNRIVPLMAEGLSRLNFKHVVCTATGCMVRYFARRHLTPTILTEARVADLPKVVRDCWGSYYLKDPAVAFGDLAGVLADTAL